MPYGRNRRALSAAGAEEAEWGEAPADTDMGSRQAGTVFVPLNAFSEIAQSMDQLFQFNF